MSKRVLVIHGPNLQLLGTREVDVYGETTLDDINAQLLKLASELDCSLDIHQFNHEGDVVETIGKSGKEFQGILINPAAYTHTSVAIRDALSAVNIPAVEVHLSHIHSREEFRKESMTAPACVAIISGFGVNSYLLGLRGLIEHLDS